MKMGVIPARGILFTNAFKFVDTHGVPLAVVVETVRSKGTSISIPHFYRNAIAAGWKQEKALAVVREALVDVGESIEYVDAAVEWLKTHRELPDPRAAFASKEEKLRTKRCARCSSRM